MKIVASSVVVLVGLILSFTPVAATGDVCDRWSLHGFQVGMPAHEALEVDLEGDPRAGVVKVKRNSRRIAFKYRDGGGGKVWFGPDGTVARMRSSRSDAWDGPVPPPSSIVSYGEQARLLWVDARCDVGITMTQYRTDVITSRAFLARPKNRYDLAVGSVEAAYRYGHRIGLYIDPPPGTLDQSRYVRMYCGWPTLGGLQVAFCTLGDLVEAQRRAYWDWINYLESLKNYPRYGSRAELNQALSGDRPAPRAPSGAVMHTSGGNSGRPSGGENTSSTAGRHTPPSGGGSSSGSNTGAAPSKTNSLKRR